MKKVRLRELKCVEGTKQVSPESFNQCSKLPCTEKFHLEDNCLLRYQCNMLIYSQADGHLQCC